MVGRADRVGLIRQAFRLEWLTIAWMTVEAVVAIASGIVSGSVPLAAFGIDSVIELLSASVLVWRLTDELKRGEEFSDRTERIASRIAALLLLALATYILGAAGFGFVRRRASTFSAPGLVVTVLAVPVMYLLARRKLALAHQLNSVALRADAIESLTCGWLSLVVVFGLLARLVSGAWWIDAVTSLGIAAFVLKEAREAWVGECCHHALT